MHTSFFNMIEDIGQKFFQQHICRIDCGNKWKIFRSSLAWTDLLGIAQIIERIIVILSTRVQIPPFHHGGKLVRVNFTSCTSTSISRTILFNRGENLACVRFFPSSQPQVHIEQHHSTVGES